MTFNQVNIFMETKLLPNHFKKIGTIIAITSFIAYILLDIYVENEKFPGNTGILRWIIKDVALIAVILIAFSKEKTESLEISLLRFDKIMKALLFGAGILILDSISDMIFSGGNFDLRTGYKTIMTVLIFYLLTFNFRNYDHKR